MADLTLFEKTKLAIGAKNTVKDALITDWIAGAKADLAMKGLDQLAIDETDQKIVEAIQLYVSKKYYGGTDVGDRFAESYESAAIELVTSGKYRV